MVPAVSMLSIVEMAVMSRAPPIRPQTDRQRPCRPAAARAASTAAVTSVATWASAPTIPAVRAGTVRPTSAASAGQAATASPTAPTRAAVRTGLIAVRCNATDGAWVGGEVSSGSSDGCISGIPRTPSAGAARK